MKVLFCCAVAAMCAAGPLLAQTSSATPAFAEQMRQLEHRRLEALVAGDRAAADRLTAEDYHLISPFGTIDDKAAELRSLDGHFYVSLTPGPIAVRRAGPDGAILRYQITAVVRLRAGPHEAHYWHTDYYERRGGRWQVVWSQSTEIRAPATPTPPAVRP
jgi:uncharacterized protein DUF4440